MRKGILCLSLILLCVLCLSVPVSATITGTTVTNTNIYGTSNIYQISPDDGTAPSISISGQYLYYTGISAVPTLAKTSDTTVTFSLANQRGAAVLADTTGTKSGMLISTASGVTADYLYDTTYNTQGVQTVTITSASNPSQTVSTTATTTVNVYFAPDVSSTSISINPSSPKGGISQSITLSLTNAPTVPTGDTYKYLYFIDNSRIGYTSTNYVKSFDITKPAGTYELKCKIVSSKSELVSYVYSNITFYAPPITNTTVTNTNIYGTSSVYDVAPESSIGAGVTTSGITHVSGQYLTYTNVSITPATGDVGDTFSLSITGQKGATVNYDSANSVYIAKITDSIGAYYLKNVNEMRNTPDNYYTPSIVLSNPSQTLSTVTRSYTILANPIPNEPGAPLQPVSIPYTITLTASCQNEFSVQSYVWQTQNNGVWSNVSTGAQYEPTLSQVKDYVYRFLAIGKNGAVVPSNSVTVKAGYKPTAVITQPETGTLVNVGSTTTIKATVGGTDATYTWDYGSDAVEHGALSGTINAQSQEITTYVKYQGYSKGQHTVTLTVTNIYGTKAVYEIVISNGRANLRPSATSTVTEVDSSGIYNLINFTAPISVNNSMPNMTAMVTTVTAPFTAIIGEWFYLVLFAVPYLILFLRQKNILIPSILGVLFAAWLLVFLPGVAMKAAIGIIILCVVGGMFGLYVKRQS